MAIGIRTLKNSNRINDLLCAKFHDNRYLIVSMGQIIYFYTFEERYELTHKIPLVVIVDRIFPIEYKEQNLLLFISHDGQYSLFGKSSSIYNTHYTFRGNLFSNSSILYSVYNENYAAIYLENKKIIIFSLKKYNKEIFKREYSYIYANEKVHNILLIGNMLYILLSDGKRDILLYKYFIDEEDLSMRSVYMKYIQYYMENRKNINIYLFGMTSAKLFIDDKICEADEYNIVENTTNEYIMYYIHQGLEINGCNYILTKNGDLLKTVDNKEFFFIANFPIVYDIMASLDEDVICLLKDRISYRILKIHKPLVMFNMNMLMHDGDFRANSNYTVLHKYNYNPQCQNLMYEFLILTKIIMRDCIIHNIIFKYGYLAINTDSGTQVYRIQQSSDFILRLRYKIFDMKKIKGFLYLMTGNGIYRMKDGNVFLVKELRNNIYGLFLRNTFLSYDKNCNLILISLKTRSTLKKINFSNSLRNMKYKNDLIHVYTFENKRYKYTENLELLEEKSIKYRKKLKFGDLTISWKNDIVVNKNKKIRSNMKNIKEVVKIGDFLFWIKKDRIFVTEEYRRIFKDRTERVIRKDRYEMEGKYLLYIKKNTIVMRMEIRFPVRSFEKYHMEGREYVVLIGKYSNFLLIRNNGDSLSPIQQSTVVDGQFLSSNHIHTSLFLAMTSGSLLLYELKGDVLYYKRRIDSLKFSNLLSFKPNSLIFNYDMNGLGKLYFLEDEMVEFLMKRIRRTYLFKINTEEIFPLDLFKYYLQEYKDNQKMAPIFNKILQLPIFRRK